MSHTLSLTHTHTLVLSEETDIIDERDNLVPSNSVTSKPLPLYTWVAMTTTPCSTTCGFGKA